MQNNVYTKSATPQYGFSDFDTRVSEPELASRGRRLGGAMIDGLLQMLVLTPLQYVSGVYDDWRHPKLDGASMLLWAAVSLAIWVLLHGLFLQNGQTIGKKILGMQIVGVDDTKPLPVGRVILRRHLVVGLLSMVPFVGRLVALADVLLIFDANRRCLHDRIAGTRVIRVR